MKNFLKKLLWYWVIFGVVIYTAEVFVPSLEATQLMISSRRLEIFICVAALGIIYAIEEKAKS